MQKGLQRRLQGPRNQTSKQSASLTFLAPSKSGTFRGDLGWRLMLALVLPERNTGHQMKERERERRAGLEAFCKLGLWASQVQLTAERTKKEALRNALSGHAAVISACQYRIFVSGFCLQRCKLMASQGKAAATDAVKLTRNSRGYQAMVRMACKDLAINDTANLCRAAVFAWAMVKGQAPPVHPGGQLWSHVAIDRRANALRRSLCNQTRRARVFATLFRTGRLWHLWPESSGSHIHFMLANLQDRISFGT